MNRLLFLALLSSLFLSANPVTVGCTNGTPVYSDNGFTGSCNGLDLRHYGDRAGANVDLSFGIMHNVLSGSYSLKETISDFAAAGFNPLGSSSLFATLNYSQVFNSGGAVRPGFLEIMNEGAALKSYNGAQQLTMGFPDGSLTGVPRDVKTQSVCEISTGCGYYGPGYYNPSAGIISYPIPILLGTNMTLIAVSSLFDGAGPTDGISTGFGSASFNFRLTEANGAPVSLIPTPEPETWGLLALGVLCLRGLDLIPKKR